MITTLLDIAGIDQYPICDIGIVQTLYKMLSLVYFWTRETSVRDTSNHIGASSKMVVQ